MDQPGESRPLSTNEGHESRKGTLRKAPRSVSRDPAPGGLFSGVFNYVTAEVGSFITNATGGVITVNTGTTSRRVKHTGHDPEMRRRKKKRTKDWTESVERETTSEKSSRNSEGRSKRSSSSADHELEPEINTLKLESIALPKATMPGSLFPRSPSLMPSVAGQCHRTGAEEEEEPRVSWNFGFDENEAGPSSGPVPPTQLSPTSPFRPPLVPSVRDAVSKFHTGPDIDPRILLPSPPRRKGKEREVIDVDADDDSWLMPPRSNRHIASDGDISREIRVKGKERELSAAIEEHKMKEKRWERDKESVTGDEENVIREKERDKEKIRKLEEEIERLKEELRRRPAPSPPFPIPPPPPPPPQPPLAISIAAPSALNNSNAPAPFAHARAALNHAPTPKEAPINPPRRGGQPTVGVTADKMAAFLTEMKTVRLRKVGSQSTLGKSTGNLSRRDSFGDDNSRRDSFDDLNLERSRLSISDLRTTKEILDIRTQHGPSVGPSSAVARELSWPSTRSVSSNSEEDASGSLHRKRKRMESAHEEINQNKSGDLSSQIQKLRESIRNKRRTMNSSYSKINPTSTFHSSYPFRRLPPTASGPSQSIVSQTSFEYPLEPVSSSVVPQGIDFSTRVRGSISTDSTSFSNANHNLDKPDTFASSSTSAPADTPSLCSDNDAEMDAERPEHDNDSSTPPSTPPGITARFTTPQKYTAEVIDLEVDLVDDHDPSEDQRQSRRRSSPHPSAYLTTKRIPVSPLPNMSPKRPKPPASSRRRTRTSTGRATTHPIPATPPSHANLHDPEHQDDEGDEDPLLLRLTGDEDDFVSLSSVLSQRQPPRRRSTLDEEMRAAHRASLNVETQGGYSEDELENGVLVATGARSKNLGFLAHGGAGGPPVWMGEGYVLGVGDAEEEEQREDHRLSSKESGKEKSRTRIPIPKSKPPMVMRGR
ncbi:hypothetical protein EV359DRAFT_84491 [Lentinula novae-zelandiae]|nr:hypothetical protein EV359DRAFT_84491 [Lentinula novae-zelandiae]